MQQNLRMIQAVRVLLVFSKHVHGKITELSGAHVNESNLTGNKNFMTKTEATA